MMQRSIAERDEVKILNVENYNLTQKVSLAMLRITFTIDVYYIAIIYLFTMFWKMNDHMDLQTYKK